MNYHIGRDGQQLGSFTKEQIIEGLAQGTLQGTDLAWSEGMDDWQPVSTLIAEATAVPPLPPTVASLPAKAPVFSGEPQKCGLATASMVLGILSFLLSCLTAIPAVICGHMALSKISRSGGSLAGGGMAVAGLVMGYICIVMLPVVAILAALAVPAFSSVQDKAHQAQSMNNVRQVMISLKSYAADNNGKYPPSLDELVKTGVVADQKTLDTLLDYPQFKGWTAEKGYEYSGGTDADPGNKVILMSRSHAQNGRRILGYNDGSVQVAIPPAN